MATPQEIKDIRRNQNKFIKEKAKKWREENDKIFSEYGRLLKEGKSEERVIQNLSERFECKRARIRNVINRQLGSASPKSRAMTEAVIISWLNQLDNRVKTACDAVQEQLIKIDLLREADEEWIDIEMTEGIKGTTIKRVPLDTAERTLLEAQIGYTKDLVTSATSALPKNIINIDNRTVEQQYTDDELNRELKEAENLINIKTKKGE